MRNRLAGIVSVLTVAGVLSACGGGGGTSAAGGDGPIVIGSHVPLTGPASFVGQGFEVGAELAQKEINANGGINGRQLELKFVDDKGTTDGALTAVRQLLTRDKALAILGGSTSTSTLGAVPYFRQNPDALYYVSLASDPRVLEQFNKNIFVGSALFLLASSAVLGGRAPRLARLAVWMAPLLLLMHLRYHTTTIAGWFGGGPASAAFTSAAELALRGVPVLGGMLLLALALRPWDELRPQAGLGARTVSA